MVYVTSQPVHPLILEYYFQLLAGIPASHARARLTLLCAHDASPRFAHGKDPRAAAPDPRIRYGIADPSRAFLTVFNATPLERRLAVLLGIPLNGVDPALVGPRHEVRKPEGVPGGRRRAPRGLRGPPLRGGPGRGARRAARRRPGISPRGREIRGELLRRGQRHLPIPGGRRARRPSGRARRANLRRTGRDGRDLPPEVRRDRAASSRSSWSAPSRPRRACSSASTPRERSCSSPPTTRSSAARRARCTRAAVFPAADPYRREIRRLRGESVGRVLARKGVVSRLGVDFFAGRAADSDRWETCALEINLRIGGTTHPFLALQFLTGGKLEPNRPLPLALRPSPKFYRSTDNLRSDVLSRALSGGSDRHHDHQPPALQPCH